MTTGTTDHESLNNDVLNSYEAPKRDTPLAIVGTGYKWNLCPFGKSDWEYWTMNNMHVADDSAHYTQWFQLHQPGSKEGHVDEDVHKEFLKVWDKPIWIQRKDYVVELGLEGKNWKLYPFAVIMDKFCPRKAGGDPYPYFTNSIDYMLCLGIHLGFNPIYLYGVEFVSSEDDEYYKMRQSLEYYIGKASSFGTRIVIQDHSALLKAEYIYAWERKPMDTLDNLFTNSLTKLEGERTEAESKMLIQKLEVATRDGAIQTLKQIRRVLKLKEKGVQL